MKRSERLLRFLQDPPLGVRITVYLLTLACAVGALLGMNREWHAWYAKGGQIALYACAAILLSYTVYLLIRFVPHARKSIYRALCRFELTRTMVESYGFRTLMFAFGSLLFNVVYAFFNGVLGILGASVWYGALAGYYLLLAVLRFGVLHTHAKRNWKQERLNAAQATLIGLRSFRNCGIWLLVLQTALSVAIAQMIFAEQHFSYPGWTVYAFAAYTFYKGTMAVIHLFFASRGAEWTVRAIRAVNLTDAAVSLLALQTALLHTFADGETSVSLFNTLTGVAVTALTVSLGVGMIALSNRKIKEIKTENTNGTESI